MFKFIEWFFEILKYDPIVVLRYWISGRDFIEERNKWKSELTETNIIPME